MTRFVLFTAVAALAVALPTGADDKAAKQPAGGAAALDRMKKLAGTWVAADDKGRPTDKVMLVYKVISAGSTVHETMFPGSDHEMVTVYHLDGKDLVLTHYCALGNQPKLKLDPKSTGNVLKFDFAGGTNIDPKKDMHMHEGSITFADDDHIEWSWKGYADGKPADGISLKLVRKK
jgi:hypothetical protein